MDFLFYPLKEFLKLLAADVRHQKKKFIEHAIEKVFDLRPHAIIKQLDLRKPIYKNLAAYGHMGREDLGVSWEKLDKVEELKAAIK